MKKLKHPYVEGSFDKDKDGKERVYTNMFMWKDRQVEDGVTGYIFGSFLPLSIQYT
jgi:hypothetical protein